MPLTGIVHTSQHEEFKKGTKVSGLYAEPYLHDNKLHWLTVRLANGVKRDILVRNLSLITAMETR